ncbi:histidine phosphatase family protein [Paenibacillus oceani]|uniref:Histidine phosphatase family protein n=1 Tax=Paenibacillus oceani TaxID=2772510 RepID=A0A927GYN5_9BACL|nr:histidine phosphatase family protein [Paenibacillus oceani]MBD2860629.1 histidine phosphatase family protein [Paenibacillus oceani]
MKLLMIRHADPDYPNDTITAQGHREAQALAQALKQRGRYDRIYSSPINRAVHTAQYTADAMQSSVILQPWAAELSCPATDANGALLAGWDVPGETVRSNYPVLDHAAYMAQPPYSAFSPRIEQVRTDSDAFFLRHGYKREGGVYRIVEPNQECNLLFCHLGFGMTLLSVLLELPLPLVWSGFFLPPSSVTTIVMEQRSAELAVPRCVGLGDVSHLRLADLSVSNAGLNIHSSESPL